MYTRCPSCRAEISFEPPANAASLPDGYKHKIKCPSCGVTIGVKIPRLDSAVQPTFTPQNPNAVSSEPVFTAQDTATETAPTKAKKAPYGRAANIFVMIFSALLAVVLGLAYLVNSGSINVEFLQGIAIFDPITPILLLIEGGAADLDIVATIIALIPTITLALAAINAIVAIICCAVGTYSRAYNFIWGLLILVGGVACVFQSTFLYMAFPELLVELTGGDYTPSIMELFMLPIIEIADAQAWVAFAVPGLGVLAFFTSLFSLGVRRKKAKAE
jgi:hypothetical protein